jgi:hypothetical protein
MPSATCTAPSLLVVAEAYASVSSHNGDELVATERLRRRSSQSEESRRRRAHLKDHAPERPRWRWIRFVAWARPPFTRVPGIMRVKQCRTVLSESCRMLVRQAADLDAVDGVACFRGPPVWLGQR